ncbi:hypothetical protein, partial [Gallibacterium anatis]|uniref:hypothetical protein n=1 Tax=Gallibacterium anatis TaxID=750 RepID=UPI001E2C4FB5
AFGFWLKSAVVFYAVFMPSASYFQSAPPPFTFISIPNKKYFLIPFSDSIRVRRLLLNIIQHSIPYSSLIKVSPFWYPISYHLHSSLIRKNYVIHSSKTHRLGGGFFAGWSNLCQPDHH